MRIRTIVIGTVVAAALAFVVAGLAAASRPVRQPALSLVKPVPLQVRGTGFHARERVRVVAVVARTSVTKWVRASSHGSFAMALKLEAGHCSGLRVIAVGNAGSRATLMRPPLPACMPE
jgi:hypothetical protein